MAKQTDSTSPPPPPSSSSSSSSSTTSSPSMAPGYSFPGLNVIAVPLWAAGVAALLAGANGFWSWRVAVAAGAALILAGFSPQVAKQGERVIVLRLGRFVGSRGPGVFFLIPFIDRIARVVDQRVITSSFNAEQTLMRDTVPVNVDAVLSWHVHDPERAALEVQDYPAAVSWASQTALRDPIGRTSLADTLVGRETMERTLREMIDARMGQWGVTVQAVEMRDVIIPTELQAAMSKEAQAEREKNARVILGQAEVMIAKQFEEAGRSYQSNPVALHLRALNVLYEGLKDNAALMVVPSTAVESMGGLGTMAGLGSLMRQQLDRSGPARPAVTPAAGSAAENGAAPGAGE